LVYGPGVRLDDQSSGLAAQLIVGSSYALNDTVSLTGDVRFIRDFSVDVPRFSGAGALTGIVSDDIDSVNGLRVRKRHTFFGEGKMSVILKAGVAVLALTLPASASVLSNNFTSYYAFGDSLTDDGKLGQLFPPSLDGRFSNGPTYAEILADEFTGAGLDSANFALGGATANDVNLEPLSALSTFAGQIATFAGALGAGAVAPGSNPLVSVFFGANDFFQGRNPIEAAGDVAQGIRDIAALGEGFDDFLLLGLPDIGSTPAFAGEGSDAASAASMIFNAKLARYVRSFEVNYGLSITNFDTGH